MSRIFIKHYASCGNNVSYFRNTGGGGRGEGGDGYSKMQKQQIEFTSPAWLHSSGWDRSLHTVLIVHGYGGASQDYLPGAVLRDG